MIPSGDTRPVLIGRQSDIDVLRSIAAAPGGKALVVTGGPGVGKSALLDEAAAIAYTAGHQVIRAAGVEFAVKVSFGGLNQMLLPLRPLTARLDAGSREALSVVLGGAARSPGTDWLEVASAALSLLHLAATPHPVLLVVDDVHWLDRPSTLILDLMARRLAGTRIGLLVAARSGTDSYFDTTGLPAHELQPISDQAAATLLASQFPGLAPQVQRRLLAEAAGNPLALLELPAALTSDQRVGAAAIPPVLPVSRRGQQLFAPRITSLPEQTRQALLMLALEETGELRATQELLQTAGPGLRGLNDLVPAERAHLVRVDESAGQVVFRHPLIRSAVIELSASDDRRRAHQALARVLAGEPDRQAWHLAFAAAGPDEKVASLLASTAHRIVRRGDAAGAVTALIRAADLSPEQSDRARRLAEAAYIAGDVTGDLRRAPQLLAAATQADPKLGGTLRAAVAGSFVLLNGEGDVVTAHRLLTAAIEAGDHGYDAGDSTLIEAMWTLLMVCWFDGSPQSWAPFDTALTRLRPAAPSLLSLAARTFSDPARTGAAAVADLTSAIRDLAAETDPATIVRTAIAAAYAERVGECRVALWRVIEDGRQGGAIASAINALLLIGVEDVLIGLWDEADTLLSEGLAFCESHEYQLIAWPARYGQAMLAAARGEQEASHRLADQMMTWAVPRGIRTVQQYAHHARALAALSRGDFEDAYQQAAAISPPGTLASHTPNALRAALDLSEAAARSGRPDEAGAHAEAMRKAVIGGLSPRFAAVEHAAAGLAETGEKAWTLFERALAVPGSDRWAFDRARIQLLYGERLRRDQAPARARKQFTAALYTFGQLGAQPWAARAERELRATGLPGSHSGRAAGSAAGPQALTAREREIALLAATGLPNKQIAERLFLSPRTVSDHLYKVFPKLGISSRAALRDALGDDAEPGRERPEMSLARLPTGA